MTAANPQLTAVLERARAVLFDFDGPICSVFAGLPASTVALQLRQAYAEMHGRAATAGLLPGSDPLEIVRDAGARGLPGARQLEKLLTGYELEAVRSAEPTPHAHDVVRAVVASGRRAAAVSNNSAAALHRYITEYGLAEALRPVIGRPADHLARMKPDPYPLKQALAALGIAPASAVLIGDSVSDVQAARAAGTLSIGYANKPGKAEALKQAGANAQIRSMGEVLQALEPAAVGGDE